MKYHLSKDSYYQASRQYTVTAAPLRGARRADVVVVGGGLTGIGAALRLAELGAEVVVLEARDFGWGASGRSGGQIIAGYSASPTTMENLGDADTAQALWRHSVAAVQWTKERVARHDIACDLTWGYLHVADKWSQAADLERWAEHLAARYDYHSLAYLDSTRLRDHLGSTRYRGAVLDTAGGHLHPLNYCLGLARAAQQAGAQLYRDSAVLRVGPGAGGTRRVETAGGAVECDHVVYACNAYLEDLQPRLGRMVMPVGTYIIATAPLSAAHAAQLLPSRAAVADSNFVLDYYRLSADHRMLFGGRVSYSTQPPLQLRAALKRRMTRVFPALQATPVEFTWGGYVAITRNRMPHVGHHGATWFAHGYSGHGMALSGYLGSCLAEAIVSGDHHPLAPFRRIHHHAFPGGRHLRMPLLVAGMAWYRLRDKWAR